LTSVLSSLFSGTLNKRGWREPPLKLLTCVWSSALLSAGWKREYAEARLYIKWMKIQRWHQWSGSLPKVTISSNHYKCACQLRYVKVEHTVIVKYNLTYPIKCIYCMGICFIFL
jgi:hypothetical protein